MTRCRSPLCSLLLCALALTLPSCEAEVTNPHGTAGKVLPFRSVAAIGNMFPSGQLVLVIDAGDQFVTLEEDGWSEPRHISEMFVGPCPFESIGAMGTSHSWFRGIINGAGTHFAYTWDSTSTVYEVSRLNVEFPIGAMGSVGEVQYFFERGGTRFVGSGYGGEVAGRTELPVGALGELEPHTIEVRENGRMFDSYIWNPGDIRHAVRRNLPLTAMLDSPVLWKVSNLGFRPVSACDDDGLGEFEIEAQVTLDGELVARFEPQTTVFNSWASRYPVYIEAPRRTPATLEVSFTCTEFDFTGPDERMAGRTGSTSHTFLSDGTATGTYNGTWGHSEVLIDAGPDCSVRLSFILERAP